MVLKFDVAAYALSCHKRAHLTFDILWRLVQCLDIIANAQEVGDLLHLKSTQYFKRVKN